MVILSFLFFVLSLQHNFLIMYISLWQITLSFSTINWDSTWSKRKLLFCVWIFFPIILCDYKEKYMSFFFGVLWTSILMWCFLLVIVQCLLELDLIVLLLWCMKTQHFHAWFLALKESLEEMKLKKKRSFNLCLETFCFLI